MIEIIKQASARRIHSRARKTGETRPFRRWARETFKGRTASPKLARILRAAP